VSKYRKFIKKGVVEPLAYVEFHKDAPIKRYSMLSKKQIPASDTHIAVHFVDTKMRFSKYSFLHKHNHDEINLILAEDGKLTYEIQLDDEVYKVSSPSTVFIPKGVKHSANVVSGKGLFVCIILSDKYKTS